jgi:hypothetical protein
LKSMLLSLYGGCGCDVVLSNCQQFNRFYE